MEINSTIHMLSTPISQYKNIQTICLIRFFDQQIVLVTHRLDSCFGNMHHASFLVMDMFDVVAFLVLHGCVEEHRSLGGSIISRLDNGAFVGLIYELLVFS